jgi:threonine/homoserine/homoserine lactone efflux protein
MLTLEALVSLAVFSFVSSATPGPNNLMLLASGVNFGFARTIPHMAGIGIGFMLMIFVVGLGLGTLFQTLPWLHDAIRYGGFAYMLYLAWKIANSGTIGSKPGDSAARPMTFLAAAAFQWVNPKAWAMAVSALAAYTVPDAFLASVATVALVFGAVNLPSVSVWAMFGVWLRRFLSDPKIVRIFNWTCAALLVGSLVPMLAG